MSNQEKSNILLINVTIVREPASYITFYTLISLHLPRISVHWILDNVRWFLIFWICGRWFFLNWLGFLLSKGLFLYLATTCLDIALIDTQTSSLLTFLMSHHIYMNELWSSSQSVVREEKFTVSLTFCTKYFVKIWI